MNSNGERASLPTVVGRLAHAMNEELGPGDLAELRRLDPEEPGSAAFWKVVVRHLEPAGQLPVDGPARDAAERRWAVVLANAAITRGQHRPGRRLGEALAEAELSELRLVRLLRARDHALWDAARQAARFLASKAEAYDWADFAWLVLSDASNNRESIRRRIARDYYRTIGR